MSRRGEEGLTSTQLAIVMPVVLMWIMLIVQYGLWFHAKQLASAAAAEAIDAAEVPGGTAGDGERAARSFLGSSTTLSNLEVDVDRGAELVRALVTGEAPQLVPGISWRVAAAAEAQAERFVPESERFSISERSAGSSSGPGGR